MWKKAVPAVALCSILLVGCGNKDDNVPSNNETPVEDVNNGNDVNTTSPAEKDAIDNNGTNGVEGSGNNGMGGNGNPVEGVNEAVDEINGNMNNGTDNNNGTINNNGDGVMDEQTDVKEPRMKNDNNK